MKWEKVSKEVYISKSKITVANIFDMEKLKQQVKQCPNKRIRICMHQDNKDSLHEMLIVIDKDSYVRPHRHLNKIESFHVIEGLLDVVIFDDGGEVLEVLNLGAPNSGRNFYYRLSLPYFHTVIPRTELIVFHETTNGPFNKEETVWAPWAPLESNDEWQRKLEQAIKNKLETVF